MLRPGVLALSKDDIFAVADAPNGLERIQYFNLEGLLLGGFYLQTRLAPRVVAGSTVLNGVGSMHFTGRTFLVNRPESGALFSEIDRQGHVLRQIGTLRKTGFESSNPDVHLAMNIGMPLAEPGGGFIFVFHTGVPMFRKYDAGGALLYERHIEGPELDGQIQSLPTEWRAPHDAGRCISRRGPARACRSRRPGRPVVGLADRAVHLRVQSPPARRPARSNSAPPERSRPPASSSTTPAACS